MDTLKKLYHGLFYLLSAGAIYYAASNIPSTEFRGDLNKYNSNEKVFVRKEKDNNDLSLRLIRYLSDSIHGEQNTESALRVTYRKLEADLKTNKVEKVIQYDESGFGCGTTYDFEKQKNVLAHPTSGHTESQEEAQKEFNFYMHQIDSIDARTK